MTQLALFDLDHTLLPFDSDYEWGQFLVRQGVVDALDYAQKNDQFYITNIAWTPDNREILVAWLNRGTNTMRMLRMDAMSGKLIKELGLKQDG